MKKTAIILIALLLCIAMSSLGLGKVKTAAPKPSKSGVDTVASATPNYYRDLQESDLKALPLVGGQYSCLKNKPPYGYFWQEYYGVGLANLLNTVVGVDPSWTGVTLFASDGYSIQFSKDWVNNANSQGLNSILAWQMGPSYNDGEQPAPVGPPLTVIDNADGPFRSAYGQQPNVGPYVASPPPPSGTPNYNKFLKNVRAIMVEPVPGTITTIDAAAIPDDMIVVFGNITPTTTVPDPRITSMSVDTKTAGSPTFTLTIKGTGFIGGSVVRWNGMDIPTTGTGSYTQVSAEIPASDIASAGTANVTVANPVTGGGSRASNAMTFTIENPVPSITSLNPDQATAGSPAFDLVVNGKGYNAESVVKWNGTNVPTTFVSPTKLTASIPAAGIASDGTAQVAVFNPGPGGGTSNAKTFTINAPTPPPPVSPASTWYLAEGSTDYGFDTYLTIQNPNATAVTAQVTYLTGSGPMAAPDVNLPAKSQATINPRDKLGNQDFSTKVVCKEGKSIAVDRTMSWTGPGAASPEAHSSIGVTSPTKTWYLPEGSSSWGFECWLLIQNPNASAANCTITYMIEGEGPKTVTKSVPANSRKTFNMADDIGQKDASIKVEGNIPVIPERAMYRNNRREGHDSIGTTSPAKDFYLAEGATGYNVGYITYVLVQNPNDTDATVTVTYMTGAGQVAGPSFTMSPKSRKTVRLNDQLPPNTDVSTRVHGSQPIIAERAMYWDNGTGEACHDSVGMASAHSSFYLPDGQTSEGRETWTLVQNPNSAPVTVEITYMTPTGAGNKTFTDTIPANSRMTYNMSDKGISGRAAVMVISKTGGKKIMCERAMYWNSKGAGTDTIGGFAD